MIKMKLQFFKIVIEYLQETGKGFDHEIIFKITHFLRICDFFLFF